MNSTIRNLIKEAINQLFETQDGSKKVADQLYTAIMRSEIDKNDNSLELKDEIVRALNKPITALRETSHVGDKDRSFYNFGDMYAYKLGTFYIKENDKDQTINFNNKSLPEGHLTNSGSIFKVNTPFIVIFKDTFYDFGFCDEDASDSEIQNFMKESFRKNSSRRDEAPKNFIVNNDFNGYTQVKILDYTPKALNSNQEEENIVLKSLNKGKSIFIPKHGWGIIVKNRVSSGKPFTEIAFPIKLTEKLKNGSDKKPVAPNLDYLPHNLRGKKLTNAKLKQYLSTVRTQTITFDRNYLFMKGMEALQKQKELA